MDSWAKFDAYLDLALSYFVGVCATEQTPGALLAGDRNIGGRSSVDICTNAGEWTAAWVLDDKVYWENDMHSRRGTVTTMDGSVQSLTTPGLREHKAGWTGQAPCSGNHALVPCPECIAIVGDL
jgi:hypothetical protein